MLPSSRAHDSRSLAGPFTFTLTFPFPMADGPHPPPRSIATRTGDDGTTSLLYGQRVSKDHPQIETVGTLDELNAALGFAKATRPAGQSAADFERIQQELVAFMGEVACAE